MLSNETTPTITVDEQGRFTAEDHLQWCSGRLRTDEYGYWVLDIDGTEDVIGYVDDPQHAIEIFAEWFGWDDSYRVLTAHPESPCAPR